MATGLDTLGQTERQIVETEVAAEGKSAKDILLLGLFLRVLTNSKNDLSAEEVQEFLL